MKLPNSNPYYHPIWKLPSRITKVRAFLPIEDTDRTMGFRGWWDVIRKDNSWRMSIAPSIVVHPSFFYDQLGEW